MINSYCFNLNFNIKHQHRSFSGSMETLPSELLLLICYSGLTIRDVYMLMRTSKALFYRLSLCPPFARRLKPSRYMPFSVPFRYWYLLCHNQAPRDNCALIYRRIASLSLHGLALMEICELGEMFSANVIPQGSSIIIKTLDVYPNHTQRLQSAPDIYYRAPKDVNINSDIRETIRKLETELGKSITILTD